MRITRRTTVSLGAAGLLALAGIGGAIAHNAYASAPRAATHATRLHAAADADAVQQTVGTGSQTNGPDTEVATAEAATESPEAAAGAADAPGGPDVQSGSNLQSGPDVGGNN